jgi:prephenate dehydrogenase
LEATPFFVDPIEHDGMRAAVEGLPALTALALMQEVSDTPGWTEARKLADHVFSMATAALSGDVQVQRAQIMLNATHLLPRLDALIRELMRLRRWIAQEELDALDEALEQAAVARARWLSNRSRGDWKEELSDMGVTGTFGTLKGALGLGFRGRKPEED